MTPLLSIQNLHARTGTTSILNGVDLHVNSGEVHILMGPNGSGKSTLAQVLMGSPVYEVTNGAITFQSEEVHTFSPDVRAQRGIYLGFQYPVEVSGVATGTFLRTIRAARNATLPSEQEFRTHVVAHADALGLPSEVYDRNLNEGFSGGEKKRNEILQMQLLQPTLAILDEFDSGLDVDGLKAVCAVLKEYMTPDRGLLLITHYGNIAQYIKPDAVHVMMSGKIVASGDLDVIGRVEKNGFEQFARNEKTNS